MFTDLTGKRRMKICLHAHTTLSDGEKTPEEVAAIYRAAGYDAIALTDHWIYGEAQEIGGLTVLAGCEYHVMGVNEWTGVMETYHIVGVGMTRDPAVPTEYAQSRDGRVRTRVKEIVSAIRRAGGLAVLAHPAWSLNTPEQILDCGDFDATEIYNSVSDWGMSDRPYSGLIVDQIATYGMYLPLLATDDSHHYNGEQCRGTVMVEADAVEEMGLVEALRQGRFYATQAPEVHLTRISPTAVRLVCSPAVKVAFLSNTVWSAGRVVRGENITEAVYEFKRTERYVRAEVTDADGRVGYSNIIPV